MRRVSYRLFVDACLWYPPSPRALILGVAFAGAAQVTTSEQVFDEVYRHLHARIPEHALARVEAIRDGLLAVDEHAVVDVPDGSYSAVGLRDVDDEHVVAGALAADADGILTLNRKHFPEEVLQTVGLELVDVDVFFGEPLQRREPEWVEAVKAALTFPPADVRTACDLGLALSKFSLDRTAGALMSASW